MEIYKIEKAHRDFIVGIPEELLGTGHIDSINSCHGKTKYPLRLMTIGECFKVELAYFNENTIRSAISQLRNREGKKFKVYKDDDYAYIVRIQDGRINTREQQTEFKIYPCSTKAESLIPKSIQKGSGTRCLEQHLNIIYPWGKLLVGESFLVLMNGAVKRESLESSARKYGARVGKRFRVIQHGKLNPPCFECVRIE